MVAEADESDRSFLKLFPTIAVITNIDHEHLENYGGFDDLQQAFVDFANKVPFYGGGRRLRRRSRTWPRSLPRMTRRVTTYGLDAPAADVTRDRRRARAARRRGRRAAARARARDAGTAESPLGSLTLNVPGRHNLQNALAAVAVGLELGLPFERIAAGLREFRGAERRFEVRGEPNGILVVDDYGHHPTEIAAVLAAARDARTAASSSRSSRTAITRTAALMDAFGPALAGADHIVLTDIYAAGEDPIAGRDDRRAGGGDSPRA